MDFTKLYTHILCACSTSCTFFFNNFIAIMLGLSSLLLCHLQIIAKERDGRWAFPTHRSHRSPWDSSWPSALSDVPFRQLEQSHARISAHVTTLPQHSKVAEFRPTRDGLVQQQQNGDSRPSVPPRPTEMLGQQRRILCVSRRRGSCQGG